MASAVTSRTIQRDICEKSIRDFRPIYNDSLEKVTQINVDDIFRSHLSLRGYAFDSRMVALINKVNANGYTYGSLETRVTDAAFLASHKLSVGQRFLLWFVWLFSSDTYANKVLSSLKAELQRNDPATYEATFGANAQEQDGIPLVAIQ